jgi:hypothetical protein
MPRVHGRIRPFVGTEDYYSRRRPRDALEIPDETFGPADEVANAVLGV